MEALIYKQFTNSAIEKAPGQGDRVRRFVISAGNVDRDGDTISPQGWRLDEYRANPVVLWAHSYDQLPIAKALTVGLEGSKLVATAQFAEHVFADTVLRLIDGGYLCATSVGFKPVKSALNRERGGIDYTEQTLLEFSVVPVPSNPSALVAAKRAGINVAALKGWVTEVQEALDDDDAGLELDVEDDDLDLEVTDISARTLEGLSTRAAAQRAGLFGDRAAHHHSDGLLDVDEHELVGALKAAIPAITRHALAVSIKEAVRSAIAIRRGRVD